MGGASRFVVSLVAACVLCAGGCSSRGPSETPDGGGDAAESGANVDAETSPSVDADRARTAGPLTFVMREWGVSEERVCDLDGDGSLDNAVADLGAPSSSIFASAFSTTMQHNFEQAVDPIRMILHFPWVDRPSVPEDPSTTVIVVKARDDDEPPDATDDFDGDEAYFARAVDLDACGEPSSSAMDVALTGEGFSDTIAVFPLNIGGAQLHLYDVPVLGTFAHADAGLEVSLLLCGASTAAALGSVHVPSDVEPEPSLLEVLLRGGAAVGVPSIPGLEPDLDLDGDGIERVETDDDGFVVRCIDGDSTMIEGRDCTADSRIADGFSLTVYAEAVEAIFAGLEPGWQDLVGGTCDAPPEESLWDAR